jgi:hypothetical protein
LGSSDKVYTIDLADTDPRLFRGQDRAFGTPGAGSWLADPRPRSVRKGSRTATPERSQAPRPSALVLAGTYLLGPLSVFLTPLGLRSRFWQTLAIIAFAGSLLLGSCWGEILRLLGGGEQAIILRGGLAAVVFWLGMAIWARALSVVLAERARLRSRRRQATTPWLAAIVGLLVPGLGLALAGCRRRAVAAFLAAGALAFSCLFLAHGAWWWGWRQHHPGQLPADGLPVPASIGDARLETMLTTAALLAWLVQCLEGARQAQTSRDARRPIAGDTLHVLVLVSLVAFAMLFSPARIARQLDEAALQMQGQGYRLIPRHLERGAVALDPSRPAYVLRLAELHDALGEGTEAAALRRQLRDRWVACRAMMSRADDHL